MQIYMFLFFKWIELSNGCCSDRQSSRNPKIEEKYRLSETPNIIRYLLGNILREITTQQN